MQHKAINTNGNPMAYPNFKTLQQIEKSSFFAPDPIALLTSEPVVRAKEFAITKKIADTLLVILDIANSDFPRCSIATKNRNQGATLIKA